MKQAKVLLKTTSTHSFPTKRYLTALFIICFLSSAIGGTVSTLMSVYLPVVVEDISKTVQEESINTISAYINALFIFGWALGGIIWGMTGDRIGRKKSLLLAMICYGLFTLLTGVMTTWPGLLVCRLISGFGVGGVLVISFTLISEIWPPKSRSIAAGLLSIAFPIGIFSAGLINFLITDWRTGFMVGVLPLVIALAGIYILKESVHWTSADHQKNGRNGLADLFSTTNRRNLFIGSVIFGSMLIGLWAIFSWLPTWVQSIVPAVDAQKERGISMMLLGSGGLLGGFLSGWIVNAIGVRNALLACFMLCALMSFTLFTTNSVFHFYVYPEILLLSLSFGVSQGVLSAFIPQLFPVGIRATATGFCFNAGRMVTATAVLFIGLLVALLGGYANSLVLFSSVFLIGLSFVYFFVARPMISNKFSTQ